MSPGLYNKYRPTELAQVRGQHGAVATLQGILGKKPSERPHAFLFSGPSGCGKTTLARIMAKEMGCGFGGDFDESNGAKSRGIDDIRALGNRITLAPMQGRCRVFLIDEAHQLTKEAQSATLKILEDTHLTTYWMLATTEPNKLLPTVRNRCTNIAVKQLDAAELRTLVTVVAKAEGFALDSEVAARIGTSADGSARAALVMLEQVMLAGGDADAQMELIARSAGPEKDAFEICRLLIDPRADWAACAKLINACDKLTNDTAESMRYMVLGYAEKVLLGGSKNARAYAILEAFGRNFYDSRRSGFLRACYSVLVK